MIDHGICCKLFKSCDTYRIGQGEFTTGFLERMFLELDKECDNNLSHGRYVREKVKWANTES